MVLVALDCIVISVLGGTIDFILINIVDRFIAIFGGYGISLVFRKRLISASSSS